MITTYLQAISQALGEEMRRDPDLILLGEDIARAGGAFKVTEGLFEEFGERVIDTPISEELIVGAGIGAAILGMRAVVEMQFMDFISCGFDQVVNMAATFRYRHGGAVKVPIVVRGPAGAGVHGGLFHSQSSEAWFAQVPGLKVVCPATAHDAKGLLKTAIRDDDPVIYFEHKRLYRSIKEDLPDEEILVPFGEAALRRGGRDLTFIGLARAISELARRARDGALGPDDFTGGTFTISNPGRHGNLFGGPIMLLALSYDHRVVDGALANAFLHACRLHLESFRE